MDMQRDVIRSKGIFRTTTKLVGVLCLIASCGGNSQGLDPSNSAVSQKESQIQPIVHQETSEIELGYNSEFNSLPLDNSDLLEEVIVLNHFLERPAESQCSLNFSVKNEGERCLLDFVEGNVILGNEEESKQVVKASFAQRFGAETGNGLELGSGEIMSLEVPLKSGSEIDCSLTKSVNINISCVNASRLGS